MRKVVFTCFVLILFFGSGCSDFSLRSKFRRIEKSADWHVKYDAALDYYKKQKYYKASVLLEQILPIVRGLPEGEKVQFTQAYCQYYLKFYLLASEQFKTFYETYGRSQKVEEAKYMYAYSLYATSPRPNLDQTSSISAMSSMQEFLNRYPDSKFREQAIEVIQNIQVKLEQKGFANAKQYYRMRGYKAAIIALNNFKNNFPDSKYIEEAYYLVVVSQYKLAVKSIPSKQPERYRLVVDNYKEFLDKYPSSSFLIESEKLYAESLNKLNSFKKSNT